jgi:hypothetical protein
MKIAALALCLSLAVVPAVVRAEEHPKGSEHPTAKAGGSEQPKAHEHPQPAGESAQPPMPAPGPEHAKLFKLLEGTWNADGKFWMGGPDPVVTKGTETNRVALGGFWLLSDYQADFLGSLFQGFGTLGYDQATKKYVGAWHDSWTSGITTSEGAWDDATRTLDLAVDMPDPTSGGRATMRELIVFRADGSRLFTMSYTGPDGKEVKVAEIVYTQVARREAP